MDISMPRLNGLEATERIVKALPEGRVVILSPHQNVEYYWRALRVSAAGYLVAGQTTKAIALNLKIRPTKVEYHRAKLMQSLNSFDKPGLVRFAVRTGLVSQQS